MGTKQLLQRMISAEGYINSQKFEKDYEHALQAIGTMSTWNLQLFIQANKYFNVVGGAIILDMLSSEEVEEMVDTYLKRYYGVEEKDDIVIKLN